MILTKEQAKSVYSAISTQEGVIDLQIDIDQMTDVSAGPDMIRVCRFVDRTSESGHADPDVEDFKTADEFAAAYELS